jgi:chromosome segregation ATPase
MDITMITELITSLGFPIALVIAMGIFIYKIYKQSVEREQTLMAEIKENREINKGAIETLALYAERLNVIQTDVEEIKKDIVVITEKIS